jgi:hypothetical protein
MRCGILLYRRSTFTWFSGESGPEVRDVMPVLVGLLDNAEDAIDACRLDSAVRVPTESTLEAASVAWCGRSGQPVIAEPNQGSIGPNSDPGSESHRASESCTSTCTLYILLVCFCSSHRHRPRHTPDSLQEPTSPITTPWCRSLAPSCLRAARTTLRSRHPLPNRDPTSPYHYLCSNPTFALSHHPSFLTDLHLSI